MRSKIKTGKSRVADPNTTQRSSAGPSHAPFCIQRANKKTVALTQNCVATKLVSLTESSSQWLGCSAKGSRLGLTRFKRFDGRGSDQARPRFWVSGSQGSCHIAESIFQPPDPEKIIGDILPQNERIFS
jgi:hypothetical protein